MTLPTAVPKPTPRTDEDRRTQRIASVQKLERSRSQPISKSPISKPRHAVAINRKTKIKKKPRSASEFARIYGSRARVAWVKGLVCCAITNACEGPIENAHVRTGGTGRKADARFIVPLCRVHHARLHRMGAASFEHGFGLDLQQWAERIEAAWQKFAAAGSLQRGGADES